MITAQSSDGVLHQFPDGTDPGVIDGVMKNYAAQNTAPATNDNSSTDTTPAPAPAAVPVQTPGEDPTGLAPFPLIKAAAGGLINSVAGIFGGAGDEAKATGSDLKAEAAAEDARKATVLSVMDDMDAGLPVPKTVKDAQGNTINPSIFENYKFASPDQRAAIRDQFTSEPKATNGLEAGVGDVLQKAGTGVNEAATDVQGATGDWLTDQEKGETSVKIASMLGGLVPIVGAAAAGDLPALIGVGGMQGYGEGFDNAKKAGQSDEQAATAGMLNGMVQGGLMAVPVHTAMEIMDSLPGVAKSSALKALVEVAKSSGTMVGFSQLSIIADNAVAKATYDPNRDMMQGVGDDLGVQAAVGAILPVAGAGLHVAGEAAHNLVAPAKETVSTASDVMAAPDLDTAIKAATEASTTAAPLVDTIAASTNALDAAAPDPQLEKLKTLFTGLNSGDVTKTADDSYTFNTKSADGSDVSIPLKVWDPATAPVSKDTISPDLAEAQRQYYTGEHGVDVVYFHDNPNIPFDGVVDPNQPNTLFLSNNPRRNAMEVGAHEFTHVLEDTKTPDGESLADILHQQVLGNITETGWKYAKDMFGVTAPDRANFMPGEEGDAQHAQAVTAHLITELSADLGGEAPKFDTFIPKVMDQIEQRYGASTASDIFQKFMDGIKAAMETIKKFFSTSNTVSQHLVDNLDQIHDTLAKMYAAKYGESLPSDHPANANEIPFVPVTKDLPPEYHAAKDRAATLQRWIGELDAKRREDAKTSEPVKILQQQHDAILGKVGGVESRLTGAAAARLADVRSKLDAHLNPVGDNADMATVRAAMVREHAKMAEAASVPPKGPQFSPRRKVEEIEGKPVPKEVALASGLPNSEAIASSKRWQTGRDLKVAMQTAVQRLAAKAGVDLTDKSAHTTAHLIKSVTSDVMHALKTNSGAIGWYDLKTRQALRVASLVHPEIATDPNARFAFVFGLAATSNGIKVDKNFDYANQVYNYYKEHGEMPTHLKMGLAQESINKTLEMFNTLSKKWGLEKFRKFMLTEYAMKEITALSGVKPAGEHADTIGRGAAIMGPKIGNGFFSNLYGHFDALTMDRWLIRTWGRHTGTLITEQPELVNTSRARVGDALRSLDPKDYDRLSQLVGHPIQPNMNYVDDLATAIKDASADPAKRTELASTPEGDELRKASINLVKYLDGQKEAPEGPHERVYIRKVFQAALEEVKKDPRYSAITMADMQAVLWYAEKRLYEHAKTDVDTEETGGVKGYEEENEAPDYANAAVGMVKNSNEAVLNDASLTPAQKRDRLISDRRINAALEKEANGRAAETQSGLSAPGAGSGGGSSHAGGFSDREKRAFAGAVATQDIRSARFGDEPSSFSYERKGSGDGRGLRVLKSLGVTYDAEWKAGAGMRRVYTKNGVKVPDRILELAPGDEKNAARFHQAITEAKEASKNGASVAVYPIEDYKNFKLLLSDDGKSGAAVKPDGDIISVFSTNSTGHAIMEAAIAAGGRKLDAFDTVLPDFYHSHGFVEAGRVAWDDSQKPEGWDKARFNDFNHGEPDVVLMALNRGHISPQLEKAKVYPDWDGAARAQEKMVKKFDREQPASIINLRLDRLDGGKPFNMNDAKAELAKFGVDVVASRTRRIEGKDGEPGVVLHLSRPLSAEEATKVSEALKQEAIPQFANGRGEMHGPDTSKYGDFNPEKFHPLVEGQALHSPRIDDAARDRIMSLHPDFANLFRKPSADEGRSFRTSAGAIAAEHAAEVSSLEAEGTKAAAPKTSSAPAERSVAEGKTRTLTTQHPEGKGKTIERALNNEQTKALENQPQEDRARALVDKDPARALRIAMRQEQPPKDLLPTFVYFELERRATAAGDEDMIDKLRTSPLAKEVTTAARTVQSFATRDPQSAVAKIQEVEQAREAAAETQTKNTGGLENTKAAEVAKTGSEIRKKVKEQIKARPLSDWDSFIKGITCG